MKLWTTKEVAYVKRTALLAETNEVLNIKEMAKRLDRTVQSVRNKIYNLQRSGEMPSIDKSKQFDTKGRHYSKEEDKRIISMYKAGATYKEIAEALERGEISVTSHIYKLRKDKKLKVQKVSPWTEEQTLKLLENVSFDDNGFVNNHNELMRLTNKQYGQVTRKIYDLRKKGEIRIYADRTKTSVKSKQAMNQFNDARFAQYKKKEDKPVEPREKQTSEIISVESREVSLILTTVNLSDRRIDQYYTKDGQLLAVKKEPTSFADEVSH
ncbi:helix-turn-helix domain containing protein [Enterococcus faecalis]